MILKPDENMVQQELDKFYQFANPSQFVISKTECYTMVFLPDLDSMHYCLSLHLGTLISLRKGRPEATILGVQIN